jgi:hypothetical protein
MSRWGRLEDQATQPCDYAKGAWPLVALSVGFGMFALRRLLGSKADLLRKGLIRRS